MIALSLPPPLLLFFIAGGDGGGGGCQHAEPEAGRDHSGAHSPERLPAYEFSSSACCWVVWLLEDNPLTSYPCAPVVGWFTCRCASLRVHSIGCPKQTHPPTHPPLQLERKGYFIVDAPFTSPDKPIVLLNIPDGRARVFPGMPAP